MVSAYSKRKALQTPFRPPVLSLQYTQLPTLMRNDWGSKTGSRRRASPLGPENLWWPATEVGSSQSVRVAATQSRSIQAGSANFVATSSRTSAAGYSAGTPPADFAPQASSRASRSASRLKGRFIRKSWWERPPR